ncbi:hypothetical protein [Streptomyces sp. bgisy034]|uniref:hypothetical protein n=1 Tax=Streptomyces sp. bgisy034 TaxID=3413774 RepID=UPI003EBAF1AE
MTTAERPTAAHVDEQLAPAEDHSTGTAWRTPEARPTPEFPPRYRPCTPAEQAAHMAALTEGISGYVVGRRGRCA